jgi:CDP-diacylglycerol--serine O-phosphatidyltransferase
MLKRMLIGKYNRSVILTYLGVASAVAGVFLALNRHVAYAMVCLIFSGIADLFDGMLARRCKRTEEEKAFGVQIDSLADMASFVMLPAALLIAIGLDRWYHAVLCGFYVLAAIIRLGWFNVRAADAGEERLSHYSGLPVTYAALGFPAAWALSPLLPQSGFGVFYAVVMACFALLFVLNIPIKKPRGPAYAFFGLLAVVLTAVILMIGD